MHTFIMAFLPNKPWLRLRYLIIPVKESLVFEKKEINLVFSSGYPYNRTKGRLYPFLHTYP